MLTGPPIASPNLFSLSLSVAWQMCFCTMYMTDNCLWLAGGDMKINKTTHNAIEPASRSHILCSRTSTFSMQRTGGRAARAALRGLDYWRAPRHSRSAPLAPLAVAPPVGGHGAYRKTHPRHGRGLVTWCATFAGILSISCHACFNMEGCVKQS